MCKFRALMLWTDSWISDTHHLTRLERGTYHDLLVLMWRTPGCRVPNDDAWLGKRLGMTPEEVRDELRPLIAEFCQTSGNWITQKRLTKEFTKTKEVHEKRSVSAKARENNKKKSTQVAHLYPVSKKEREEDTIVPFRNDRPLTPKSYFFERGVIRLSREDFAKWEEAFSHLSLRAELEGLADWAGKQENWFFAVSGALAKRNREEHREVEKAKVVPEKQRSWLDAIV